MNEELKSQTAVLPEGEESMWEILKKIVKVSFPMLITNATFALMLFCDRTMLAHYDLDSAGASLAAGVISFTVQCFFMGVAQYTSTMVAQYHGAKDKRMVAVSVWQSLYFVVLVGLCVPWISRPLGIWLLELSGHAPALMEMEKAYYSYMAFFIIIPLTNVTLSGFFNGRSKVWVATIANVFGCACNVLLNYVLIFGHWGFAPHGIVGAAQATILAGLCTSAFFWTAIRILPSTREYNFFSHWRFRRTSFVNLLRFGVPTGIMFGLDNAAFAVQVLFTGRLGVDPLNASTVTFSIQNLVFLPLLSVAAGAAIVMAQYIGMNRRDLGRRAVWLGLVVSWAVLIVINLLIFIYTREIFDLFCGGQHSNEVYLLTRTLLYWTMLYNFLDVVNLGLNNALRSAGDTNFTMWVSLALNWLFFVPAILVCTELLHYGIYSIWVVMGVFFAVCSVVFLWRFKSGAWEKINVMELNRP